MTQPQQPEPVEPAPGIDPHVAELLGLLAAGATLAAIVALLALVPGIGATAAKALFGLPFAGGREPEEEPGEGHIGGQNPWANLLKIEPTPLAHRVVRAQQRQNLLRRAQYLVAAGRRVSTAALKEKREPGSIAKALEAERRYLKAHLVAVKKRNEAARAVADEMRKAAVSAGPRPGLLGWYNPLDKRTSPECRAATGRNFDPLKPPSIGLPGAVHVWCRCYPGPAFNTDKMVDGLPLVVAASNGEFRMRLDLSGDHDSSTHPDLVNKPGKTNWVEKSGGLPSYIKRVAKHIVADSGLSEGHAIAAAHNWCIKQAAKGNAEAAAAIAEWNAKAAAARASHKG